MRPLLAAERFKLRKNHTFQTLILFLAVTILLYAAVACFSQLRDGGFAVTLTVMELYANAITINQLLLKILLGVLAGFFIASEYAAGVLKRSVSAGRGREWIYASKLAVYTLGVVSAALVIPVLAILLGCLLNGLGLLAGFGRQEGVTLLAYSLRTLGFTALFGAGYASIAAWIAVWLADAGRTIGVSIVFFLFVDQILNSLSGYFPLLKSLYDYSLFKLFADTAAFQMSGEGVLLCLIVPIATIAVFALLGVCRFRRKEIH
ncbi:ABC transporter permease [Cohnella caldifontis]|uniref:ABC transporter permease n=1 Tax=Cohnella caldifontis TaxID=3027471 RepID=UPI0023EBCE60|nr:ABC transporter permease [Cohnella sp. YIM B05605]